MMIYVYMFVTMNDNMMLSHETFPIITRRRGNNIVTLGTFQADLQ